MIRLGLIACALVAVSAAIAQTISLDGIRAGAFHLAFALAAIEILIRLGTR